MGNKYIVVQDLLSTQKMKLYRYSPIRTAAELLEAIKHTHYECNKLCFSSLGEYLPNAGNVWIFCHYDDEYDVLSELREKMTVASDNLNQKYFRLHEPIELEEYNGIPKTTYTYLYVRKPDPYRHHVGDVDFYLEEEEYKKLKQYLADGNKISWARIFDRGDLDMIELHNPDSDVLWYISTERMTDIVRVKQV